MLWNKDIDAAIALIVADRESPSIVPQHEPEHHRA
jgi:hypothetical protein